MKRYTHTACPFCRCTPKSRATERAETTHRRQSEATDKATRHREEWTDADFEILAREDLTMPQKAAALNRTYYAIKTKIERMRKAARATDSRELLA